MGRLGRACRVRVTMFTKVTAPSVGFDGIQRFLACTTALDISGKDLAVSLDEDGMIHGKKIVTCTQDHIRRIE